MKTLEKHLIEQCDLDNIRTLFAEKFQGETSLTIIDDVRKHIDRKDNKYLLDFSNLILDQVYFMIASEISKQMKGEKNV